MHKILQNIVFPVTRENMAKLLAEYIDGEKLLLDIPDRFPDEYADINSVSPSAKYAVELVTLYGLMEGDNKKRFNPKHELAYAQALDICEKLKRAKEMATHSQNVFTAVDFVNLTSLLYSNMSSDMKKYENNVSYLFMSPYKTHCPSWYVGMDAVASNVRNSSLCWVKICIKSDQILSPVLRVSSPVYDSYVKAYSVENMNGYTVLTFNMKENIIELQKSNLTLSKVARDTTVQRQLHLKSVNGRYLHIALYPFSDKEDVTAQLLYMGFFEDEHDCLSYDISSLKDMSKEVHSCDTEYLEWQSDVESMYIEQMNAKIAEIVNSESSLLPGDIEGTCYYISSVNGDDSNDGLSPQSAWKSPAKLVKKNDPEDSIVTYEHIVKHGDGVFFERGSVFNSELKTRYSGNYAVEIRDGVNYGAYGEGEKPVFTNCMDYNGNKNWSPTEYPNIWRLDDKVELPKTTEYSGYSDIGNIIVITSDGTVGYGIKVLANDPENAFNGEKTVDIGMVTNGFEVFKSGGVELYNLKGLKNNLEYIHDWNTGYVYMYCDKGNPAEVYDKVILAKRGACFFEGSNSIIDNIAFKYIGTFGISVTEAKNLVIKNCTFEWIGGAIQGGTTVYGGGIQNWNNCDKFHIIHCYADQMLDAAFSTQGGSGQQQTIMNDVLIEDCVAINTNSSVELWNYAQDNLLCNVRIRNNYFGYAGYHFGNRKVLKDACILQLGIASGQILEKVVYEENINMFASSSCYWARPFLCRGDSNGTLLRNNVYLLSNKKVFMITSPDFRNDTVSKESNYVELNEGNIEHLCGFGIDKGSKFYVKDDFFNENERNGVYVPPYLQ